MTRRTGCGSDVRLEIASRLLELPRIEGTKDTEGKFIYEGQEYDLDSFELYEKIAWDIAGWHLDTIDFFLIILTLSNFIPPTDLDD
jgi:hypothetical protein